MAMYSQGRRAWQSLQVMLLSGMDPIEKPRIVSTRGFPVQLLYPNYFFVITEIVIARGEELPKKSVTLNNPIVPDCVRNATTSPTFR